MTEEHAEPVKKSEKPASRARDRHNKRDKAKPLTKVIVRRLPPTMTEEIFLKQIEPLPDHENYYFVQADWSLGHDATSRAYINFTNQDDIFLFKDRFDGYVFVDQKGAEYPAIVEFAPFQGLPRNKSRKKDPKSNTIETDPHYISFLETLANEENEGAKTELKMEYSYQIKSDKKITSTPLLQYLANKKQERRDEKKRKLDEKRRQRDEERQRKKTQIAKSIPQPIKEEDSKISTKEKDGDRKRDREKVDEIRKDSRARRKADREQKRKQEREKNQQKPREDKPEQTLDKNDNKEKEDEDKNKKEIKKYSQSRREKLRARNEGKAGSSNNNSSSSIKDNEEFTQVTNEDTSRTTAKPNAVGEVSESVKEFIKTVANIREFVPRNREGSEKTKENLEILAFEKVDHSETDMDEVKQKLEQIALWDDKAKKLSQEPLKDTDRQNKSPENENQDSSNGGASVGTDRDRKNEREEKNLRRIRNKDRPSLEIYQPGKLRLNNRKEDGRSSSELKDYKSNPTSDCEGPKKEKDEKVTARKKVSRYSERRTSRAKDKGSKDSNDINIDSLRKLSIDSTNDKEITVESSSTDNILKETEQELNE